jgi:hypothetical protein
MRRSMSDRVRVRRPPTIAGRSGPEPIVEVGRSTSRDDRGQASAPVWVAGCLVGHIIRREAGGRVRFAWRGLGLPPSAWTHADWREVVWLNAPAEWAVSTASDRHVRSVWADQPMLPMDLGDNTAVEKGYLADRTG